MRIQQLDFEQTNRFSPLFLDYIKQKPALADFYNLFPDIENFAQAIHQRNFDDTKRETLVEVLNEQYRDIDIPKNVSCHIELLRQPNTFTITTGHQLNIFTGPLFFIYKISAAINIAQQLSKKYPDQHFVPVYWMASEDHDFAEINNFNLFGKKYVWDSDQKGPVGTFKTDGFASLFEELPDDMPDFCRDGYVKSDSLAAATRYLVNKLFGDHGLVILDADDARLKQYLQPVMLDDLFDHTPHEAATQATQRLEGLGYKGQIFPRPINFFFMEPGVRERIELNHGKYTILNTDQSLTSEEMKHLVQTHPEKLSPNVVLRPVYQELILPNLAYVGGPAEVSYWLQLKGVFDHFSTPFPILFPRLFGMVISRSLSKKIAKIPLRNEDLFKKFEDIKTSLLYDFSEPVHQLTQQYKDIEKAFDAIGEKAALLDKSLEGMVISEHKKVEKSIHNIEKRLKKAEEQKEAVKLSQVQNVLSKLFPDGHPQEREENFLNFYINNTKFIDGLLEVLDPFDLRYNVITEDG